MTFPDFHDPVRTLQWKNSLSTSDGNDKSTWAVFIVDAVSWRFTLIIQEEQMLSYSIRENITCHKWFQTLLWPWKQVKVIKTGMNVQSSMGVTIVQLQRVHLKQHPRKTATLGLLPSPVIDRKQSHQNLPRKYNFHFEPFRCCCDFQNRPWSLKLVRKLTYSSKGGYHEAKFQRSRLQFNNNNYK